MLEDLRATSSRRAVRVLLGRRIVGAGLDREARARPGRRPGSRSAGALRCAWRRPGAPRPAGTCGVAAASRSRSDSNPARSASSRRSTRGRSRRRSPRRAGDLPRRRDRRADDGLHRLPPARRQAEALESIAFLDEHRAHWNIAGLGQFTLTPGAIVALRPQDFGIVEHGPHAGDDIARVLRYRDGSPKTAEESENVERAKRRLDAQHFDRPFAGGSTRRTR